MSLIWSDSRLRKVSDEASMATWLCVLVGCAAAAAIVAIVIWLGR